MNKFKEYFIPAFLFAFISILSVGLCLSLYELWHWTILITIPFLVGLVCYWAEI